MVHPWCLRDWTSQMQVPLLPDGDGPFCQQICTAAVSPISHGCNPQSSYEMQLFLLHVKNSLRSTRFLSFQDLFFFCNIFYLFDGQMIQCIAMERRAEQVTIIRKSKSLQKETPPRDSFLSCWGDHDPNLKVWQNWKVWYSGLQITAYKPSLSHWMKYSIPPP